MDGIALLLSFLISIPTLAGVAIYILFSRLYSYRGIRLKKFPLIGYLTVILNQGGLIFYLVYQAAVTQQHTTLPWAGILTAILLIGGFYPITQVYQHQADKKDGVTTISILLGIRGTFLFCMGLYALAFGCMFFYITSFTSIISFISIQLFFLPVLLYFFYWMNLVWKDATQASFKHTMKMNWIASVCTNAAFIYILIQQQIG
jgi:1,4-dihydroxy-2-naphthoate octaprenyltransferase